MGDRSINDKALTSNQLNCQVSDFSCNILERCGAKNKGQLYTSFVKRCLKYIPVDYRSNDNIDFFC